MIHPPVHFWCLFHVFFPSVFEKRKTRRRAALRVLPRTNGTSSFLTGRRLVSDKFRAVDFRILASLRVKLAPAAAQAGRGANIAMSPPLAFFATVAVLPPIPSTHVVAWRSDALPNASAVGWLVNTL
jgi:hypothetical protein